MVRIEQYLSEIQYKFSRSDKIEAEDLAKVIYIYFHSEDENEKQLAKLILSKVNDKTIILEEKQDIEKMNKYFLSMNLRKTMPEVTIL